MADSIVQIDVSLFYLKKYCIFFVKSLFKLKESINFALFYIKNKYFNG